MKIKLSKLQQSVPSLNILANTKLNLKASYDISKRLKVINDELEIFDKARIDKVKELSGGKLKEDGKSYDIAEEDLKKLNEELKDLLDKEIDINIAPINLADFGNVEIEPAHLLNLDFLITE